MIRSGRAGLSGTKIAPAPQTTKQTEIAKYFTTRFIAVGQSHSSYSHAFWQPVSFRPVSERALRKGNLARRMSCGLAQRAGATAPPLSVKSCLSHSERSANAAEDPGEASPLSKDG